MLNNDAALAPQKTITRFKTCSSTKVSLTANSSRILSQENSTRIYALIQNTSSAIVTLILGSTTNATVGKGILLLPMGSYEISTTNLYVGAIGAVSEAEAQLTFVECVE